MKPLTANHGLPFVVRSPNLDLKVSNVAVIRQSARADARAVKANIWTNPFATNIGVAKFSYHEKKRPEALTWMVFKVCSDHHWFLCEECGPVTKLSENGECFFSKGKGKP